MSYAKSQEPLILSVTGVTKVHINEKRIAAKKGQPSGKQLVEEDMIHSTRNTKKFCKERLSKSTSISISKS